MSTAGGDDDVVTARDDVSLLLGRCRDVLGPAADWQTPAGYPDSLGLCVLDAVWSVGVRYDNVVTVLGRYRAVRDAVGADAAQDSAVDLRAAIAAAGGPMGFADAVGNHQLTSTRSGVLKAAAADWAAAALLGTGIVSTSELRAVSPKSLERVQHVWLAVPGQRRGISWRSLLLLAGVRQIRPDCIVVGFVTATLGRRTSAEEAAVLLTAAAPELGVDLRALDHRIWRYQTSRG